MDISSNSLSQPTAMSMDAEMNLYSNERASPAPVLGNIQSVLTTVSSSPTASPTPQIKMQHDVSSQMLTRPRLQELVREVDATEQLDEEVEEILLQLADDFVESTVNAACLLAKHRKCNTIDVKDVQLHLERNWNMWLPGFGTDELRPYKRSTVTEAHKQRLALIRKALKKY
ncbi:transcription initiation factor TFIID subunit 12 [Homalodisca vitripennis]|uniref:transcription initiation factor TFIID subunit 12 n=1 Tax=Homalodisca vitripennis TaxID=197043 RepID=UPI001EEBBD1E|nr:transcription initiation factor TFIID subunit 12 [Homalodisca vitripennis]XP_046669188.1 transcription initiation factor TFIID subunit 12 [Homalodisca vitripennis]KAG8288252.1 Transcription initiation factor TFIID subunit 12 [Homalodisca vitripennis]